MIDAKLLDSHLAPCGESTSWMALQRWLDDRVQDDHGDDPKENGLAKGLANGVANGLPNVKGLRSNNRLPILSNI